MKRYLLLFCLVSAGATIAASEPTEDEKTDLEEVVEHFTPVDDTQVSKLEELYNNAQTEEEKAIFARGLVDQNNGYLRNGEQYVSMLKWHLLIKTAIKNTVKDPKVIAYIALGALGVSLSWHGSRVLGDIAHHYLIIPPLARETSLKSWTRTVKDFFVYDQVAMPDRADIFFNDKLTKEAEDLTEAIKNAAKYDTYFRHYLFYGPPGTGKTMLAKAIAKEAGMEYIVFSGADLAQYSLEEGVRQIRHLFEYAKACPKKLLIIMDEGDAIFGRRDNCSDAILNFRTAIQTYMGTEQNNYAVITNTNHPLDFTPAMLSRFGEQLKVDVPAHGERAKIFAHYEQKYLIDAHTIDRDNRSFFQWIFSPRPKNRIPLPVENGLFSVETFNELATASEGMVGRDISDVLIAVQQKAYGTPGHCVTKQMILDQINHKKAQKLELEKYAERDILTPLRNLKPLRN